MAKRKKSDFVQITSDNFFDVMTSHQKAVDANDPSASPLSQYAVFDVETSADATIDDENAVVQVTARWAFNGEVIGSYYVNPGREHRRGQSTKKIQFISPEDYEKGVPWAEAESNLAKSMKKKGIVGIIAHNADFDKAQAQKEARINNTGGLLAPFFSHTVDTLGIYSALRDQRPSIFPKRKRGTNATKGLGMDSLRSFFGMQSEGAHTSYQDTLDELDVMSHVARAVLPVTAAREPIPAQPLNVTPAITPSLGQGFTMPEHPEIPGSPINAQSTTIAPKKKASKVKRQTNTPPKTAPIVRISDVMRSRSFVTTDSATNDWLSSVTGMLNSGDGGWTSESKGNDLYSFRSPTGRVFNIRDIVDVESNPTGPVHNIVRPTGSGFTIHPKITTTLHRGIDGGRSEYVTSIKESSEYLSEVILSAEEHAKAQSHLTAEDALNLSLHKFDSDVVGDVAEEETETAFFGNRTSATGLLRRQSKILLGTEVRQEGVAVPATYAEQESLRNFQFESLFTPEASVGQVSSSILASMGYAPNESGVALVSYPAISGASRDMVIDPTGRGIKSSTVTEGSETTVNAAFRQTIHYKDPKTGKTRRATVMMPLGQDGGKAERKNWQRSNVLTASENAMRMQQSSTYGIVEYGLLAPTDVAGGGKRYSRKGAFSPHAYTTNPESKRVADFSHVTAGDVLRGDFSVDVDMSSFYRTTSMRRGSIFAGSYSVRDEAPVDISIPTGNATRYGLGASVVVPKWIDMNTFQFSSSAESDQGHEIRLSQEVLGEKLGSIFGESVELIYDETASHMGLEAKSALGVLANPSFGIKRGAPYDPGQARSTDGQEYDFITGEVKIAGVTFANQIFGAMDTEQQRGVITDYLTEKGATKEQISNIVSGSFQEGKAFGWGDFSNIATSVLGDRDDTNFVLRAYDVYDTVFQTQRAGKSKRRIGIGVRSAKNRANIKKYGWGMREFTQVDVMSDSEMESYRKNSMRAIREAMPGSDDQAVESEYLKRNKITRINDESSPINGFYRVETTRTAPGGRIMTFLKNEYAGGSRQISAAQANQLMNAYGIDAYKNIFSGKNNTPASLAWQDMAIWGVQARDALRPGARSVDINDEDAVDINDETSEEYNEILKAASDFKQGTRGSWDNLLNAIEKATGSDDKFARVRGVAIPTVRSMRTLSHENEVEGFVSGIGAHFADLVSWTMQAEEDELNAERRSRSLNLLTSVEDILSVKAGATKNLLRLESEVPSIITRYEASKLLQNNEMYAPPSLRRKAMAGMERDEQDLIEKELEDKGSLPIARFRIPDTIYEKMDEQDVMVSDQVYKSRWQAAYRATHKDADDKSVSEAWRLFEKDAMTADSAFVSTDWSEKMTGDFDRDIMAMMVMAKIAETPSTNPDEPGITKSVVSAATEIVKNMSREKAETLSRAFSDSQFRDMVSATYGTYADLYVNEDGQITSANAMKSKAKQVPYTDFIRRQYQVVTTKTKGMGQTYIPKWFLSEPVSQIHGEDAAADILTGQAQEYQNNLDKVIDTNIRATGPLSAIFSTAKIKADEKGAYLTFGRLTNLNDENGQVALSWKGNALAEGRDNLSTIMNMANSMYAEYEVKGKKVRFKDANQMGILFGKDREMSEKIAGLINEGRSAGSAVATAWKSYNERVGESGYTKVMDMPVVQSAASYALTKFDKDETGAPIIGTSFDSDAKRQFVENLSREQGDRLVYNAITGVMQTRLPIKELPGQLINRARRYFSTLSDVAQKSPVASVIDRIFGTRLVDADTGASPFVAPEREEEEPVAQPEEKEAAPGKVRRASSLNTDPNDKAAVALNLAQKILSEKGVDGSALDNKDSIYGTSVHSEVEKMIKEGALSGYSLVESEQQKSVSIGGREYTGKPDLLVRKDDTGEIFVVDTKPQNGKSYPLQTGVYQRAYEAQGVNVAGVKTLRYSKSAKTAKEAAQSAISRGLVDQKTAGEDEINSAAARLDVAENDPVVVRAAEKIAADVESGKLNTRNQSYGSAIDTARTYLPSENVVNGQPAGQEKQQQSGQQKAAPQQPFPVTEAAKENARMAIHQFAANKDDFYSVLGAANGGDVKDIGAAIKSLAGKDASFWSKVKKHKKGFLSAVKALGSYRSISKSVIREIEGEQGVSTGIAILGDTGISVPGDGTEYQELASINVPGKKELDDILSPDSKEIASIEKEYDDSFNRVAEEKKRVDPASKTHTQYQAQESFLIAERNLVIAEKNLDHFNEKVKELGLEGDDIDERRSSLQRSLQSAKIAMQSARRRTALNNPLADSGDPGYNEYLSLLQEGGGEYAEDFKGIVRDLKNRRSSPRERKQSVSKFLLSKLEGMDETKRQSFLDMLNTAKNFFGKLKNSSALEQNNIRVDKSGTVVTAISGAAGADSDELSAMAEINAALTGDASFQRRAKATIPSKKNAEPAGPKSDSKIIEAIRDYSFEFGEDEQYQRAVANLYGEVDGFGNLTLRTADDFSTFVPREDITQAEAKVLEEKRKLAENKRKSAVAKNRKDRIAASSLTDEEKKRATAILNDELSSIKIDDSVSEIRLEALRLHEESKDPSSKTAAAISNSSANVIQTINSVYDAEVGAGRVETAATTAMRAGIFNPGGSPVSNEQARANAIAIKRLQSLAPEDSEARKSSPGLNKVLGIAAAAEKIDTKDIVEEIDTAALVKTNQALRTIQAQSARLEQNISESATMTKEQVASLKKQLEHQKIAEKYMVDHAEYLGALADAEKASSPEKREEYIRKAIQKDSDRRASRLSYIQIADMIPDEQRRVIDAATGNAAITDQDMYDASNASLSPAQQASVDEISKKDAVGAGNVLRQIFGGFGLMYMRSALGIAASGLGQNQEQYLKREQAIAQAGGQVGAIGLRPNSVNELDASMGIYGNATNPIQTIQNAALMYPGFSTAGNAIATGVSVLSLTKWLSGEVLEDKGIAAAKDRPGLSMEKGLYKTASVLNKYAVPISLALTGLSAGVDIAGRLARPYDIGSRLAMTNPYTDGRGSTVMPAGWLANPDSLSHLTSMVSVHAASLFDSSEEQTRERLKNSEYNKIGISYTVQQNAIMAQENPEAFDYEFASSATVDAMDSRSLSRRKADYYAATVAALQRKHPGYSENAYLALASYQAKNGYARSNEGAADFSEKFLEAASANVNPEDLATSVLKGAGKSHAQMYVEKVVVDGKEITLTAATTEKIMDYVSKNSTTMSSLAVGQQVMSAAGGAKWLKNVDDIIRMQDALGSSSSSVQNTWAMQSALFDKTEETGISLPGVSAPDIYALRGMSRKQLSWEAIRSSTKLQAIETRQNLASQASMQSYVMGKSGIGDRIFQTMEALAQSDPSKALEFSEALSFDPMRMQTLGQSGLGGVFGRSKSGRMISANYLATADTGLDNQLTGLPWGQTSFKLGSMSGDSWAQQYMSGAGLDRSLISAGVYGVTLPNGDRIGGQLGMSWRQMKIQQENEWKQFALQQTGQNVGYAFQTGVGLSAYNGTINPQTGKPFGTLFAGGQWGLQDAERRLGYKQQEFSFSMQQAQMNLQASQFEEDMSMNRRQSMTQRNWAVQDWGFNSNVRQMQWGWKQEDFAEDVRFMTGRQRRVAERQMRRETTMFNLEGDQINRQQDRQKELWKIEDERFAIQKKQFLESRELQEEQLIASRKFFAERKKLDDEQLKLSRAQYIVEFGLQREEMKLRKELTEQSHKQQATMQLLSIQMARTTALSSTLSNEGFEQMKNALTTFYAALKPVVEYMKESAKLLGGSTSPKKPTSWGGGYNNATGGRLSSGVHAVGEDGWEFVIDGMVVPHEVSKEMWREGLRPGPKPPSSAVSLIDSNLSPGNHRTSPESGRNNLPINIYLGNDKIAEFVVDVVTREVISG